MIKIRPLAAIACLALALTSAAATGPQAGAAPSPNANYHAQRLCDPAALRPGDAACLSERLIDAAGKPVNPIATATHAVTPVQLQDAYKVTGFQSQGRTVAIVDAYGYAKADSDLQVFRMQYKLGSCTVKNGCLRIVNQDGNQSPLPTYNAGWAGEQALDLDTVSAMCPDCKILLVQARSASFADLGTAVNTAAKLGAVAISNSYGGGDAADASYGKYYNHPDIAVTASTGDNGYRGASYPASSAFVTAVGGTTLTQDGSARGWNETVWSGSGSGCTSLNTAPYGQTSTITHCSGRAMADVSADADPSSGLPVYGPLRGTTSGWAQYGGTSLSAPIVASIYALASGFTGYGNTIPYAHPSAFFDVTGGKNGSCGAPMCTAGQGWDGPTGLGTPNGTGGF